ncbi:MAG TPA: bifunctional hydroxymethylpyrimidine kinase/phosphomethylpyrimidine kinase [Pontiella sp.]
MDPTSSTPVVWTIAGSDSGGGAGIQADLKVINALGAHGCSVITTLTAQNTQGVEMTEPVSDAMLRAQLHALGSDLQPSAIKTGMLGSASSCTIISEVLPAYHVPVVCDPVLKSTSGTNLLDPDAIEILTKSILPYVDVLTPNLPEAKALIGEFKTLEEAAEKLLAFGIQSVLIKGGHAEGDECRDYWTDGNTSLWLSSPRINTRHTHGTGCILSSAIAAALAMGHSTLSAITLAKTYLNQSLKSPTNLGDGHGPMKIEPFRNAEEDRP